MKISDTKCETEASPWTSETKKDYVRRVISVFILTALSLFQDGTAPHPEAPLEPMVSWEVQVS